VSERPDNRHAIRHILGIWAGLTAIGVVIAVLSPGWLMPTAASSTMHLLILTVVVFSVAAAPVAALVYATALYALVRWRWRGEGVPPDGPPMRNNSVVTSVWLVASSLLTVFLLVWGLAALSTDDAGGGGVNPMTVDVTGQQWVWSFSYPGTKVSSFELYLPVGRKINFDVTSKDVVHGFWIVQMGIKINANPGVITTASVTPDKIGVYDIRCSELCGLNHAFMETTVHVLSDSAFNSWLKSQPSRV
jgi:cytochrome c oxidase subunit 2